MENQQGTFFSVRYRSTIQGYDYRPAVCYKLTGSLQPTVEAMAAEGAARIYPDEVRFVSGVPYPVKKPEVCKPVPAPAPVVVPPAKASQVKHRSGRVKASGGDKEFS